MSFRINPAFFIGKILAYFMIVTLYHIPPEFSTEKRKENKNFHRLTTRFLLV